MKRSLTAKADVTVHCTRLNLDGLREIAERVDRFAGREPPQQYNLAEAVCVILNGGSIEHIQATIALLDEWSFTPSTQAL